MDYTIESSYLNEINIIDNINNDNRQWIKY